MSRSLVRIGNATLSPSMVERLANRDDEDLGVALVAAGVRPAQAVEKLMNRNRRAPLAVFAALASCERAEALERPGLLATRRAAALARLARRARAAADDAVSLRPPPPPPRPLVPRLALLYPPRRR